jgi:transcriptional regulator with XRE-family HTH domain
MSKQMVCPKCGGAGMIDDPRAIGADMRKKRQAAGLSLRAVAGRMAISPMYLSDLELGRRTGWSEPLQASYLAALNNP